MFRTSQIHYVLYILLFIAGCKKDIGISPSETKSECDLWPSNGPSIGLNPIQTRDNTLNKYNGIFDPGNPDYFYYLIDQNPGIGQIQGILIRANIKTGIKQRLDSSIIGLPQLNKAGWFVYTKADLNLYKIKTNGDSLTQLTNDKNSLMPNWSYDNNFIYYIGTPGGIKLSQDGSIIDTSNFLPIVSSKISNRIFTTKKISGNTHIILKDLNDNSEKTICTNAPDGFYLIDNSDSYLFCYNDKSIHRINILTGSVELLITNCYRKEYSRLTITLNNNFIVASRYDRSLMNDNKTIYYEVNLFKINLDGSDPIPLNIP